MRKLTAEIKDAFEEGRKLTKSNTFTDGEAVWLHGNKIVKQVLGGVKVSLAGWNTVTTRERINAFVPPYMGFVQQKHEAKFIDNREPMSVIVSVDVDKWHFFGYDGTVTLNLED